MIHITQIHRDYTKHREEWMKCRDCVEGEEAVKRSGEEHLPRLSGQDDLEYQAYRNRAMFYNAAGRTVQGLAGAIFRKNPDLTIPKAAEELISDIGPNNEAIDVMMKETVEEVLTCARVGVMIDASEGENTAPYVTIYYAENVTNWEEMTVNGRPELKRVVLKMCEEKYDEDTSSMAEEVYYRELLLVPLAQSTPADPGHEYRINIWRKVKNETTKKDEWVITKTIVPKMNGGRPLDHIPFKFGSPKLAGTKVEKSPILDLVNVNLSHYRNSADLEHGRHFTALPTPWAAGFELKAGEKLKIGSGVAWTTDQAQARCGMLEFTGAGLGHLRDALTEKEKLMAILGSRMLETQKLGVESAQALAIRQSGESSVLTNVAVSLSELWEWILTELFEWRGMVIEDGDVEVALNTDFIPDTIDPQVIAQLFAMLQAGTISWDTLFWNLKRGELIPDNRTAEDEKDLIAAGGPHTSVSNMPLGFQDPPPPVDPNAAPEQPDESDPSEAD